MTETEAECSCGTPGLTYEGPQEDCEVHGERRAVLIQQREAARERGDELVRIGDGLAAERDEAQERADRLARAVERLVANATYRLPDGDDWIPASAVRAALATPLPADAETMHMRITDAIWEAIPEADVPALRWRHAQDAASAVLAALSAAETGQR